MADLQCEIVTLEAKLFSADVHFVVLPAAEGEMGVLPDHEPVVTTLNPGSVRVTVEEGSQPVSFIVDGGYAQIDGERVIVLADRAAAVEEIDATALNVRNDELREQLQDMPEDDPNAAFLKSEIHWNETLLKEHEERAA
jgi:F-type H+-transporting ATPase subunit epsilon